MTPRSEGWLVVPLDDRPCCYRFPQQLASVQLPPRELLGHFQQPGDCDAVLDWLQQQAPDAPGAVIALDMVAWGGLVASRHPDGSLEDATRRLQRLRHLPLQRRLAFQTILRNAPTQTNANEMAWAERIVEASARNDRESLRDLPLQFVERYFATRARNAELGHRTLEILADTDYLTFALDDSRTAGWNLAELHSLGEVNHTPGTDETTLLLLVRALRPGNSLDVVWSDAGLEQLQGSYEDRPLGRLLQAQLTAAGVQADRGNSGERQLWLYGRPGARTTPEARFQADGVEVDRLWLDRLEHSLDAGHQVTLVDCSFANGGDLQLGQALLDRQLWGRLHGYAAWNTLGNRLGTGIACALLDPSERAGFLLERVADDLLYQARWRWRAAQQIGHPGLTLTPQEVSALQADLVPAWMDDLQPYAQQIAPGCTLQATFPWSRLFEVEFS